MDNDNIQAIIPFVLAAIALGLTILDLFMLNRDRKYIEKKIDEE